MTEWNCDELEPDLVAPIYSIHIVIIFVQYVRARPLFLRSIPDIVNAYIHHMNGVEREDH